jgi:hypothetical protein
MATMNFPTNLQPVCGVPGCENGAQLRSMEGKIARWMQTCKQHTYKDLPGEQQKIETFWPPETN